MEQTTRGTVLIVGMTGMLGSKVTDCLLEAGDMKVRALVRPGGSARSAVQRFVSRGVEIVEGDILKPDTLGRATEGVTAVVSTVNNLPELILDGQANLLAAAGEAGVSRFIPSDFSVDYRQLAIGDNDNLDLRIQFRPILLQSAVPYTSVLQGAFTEMLMVNGMGIYDHSTRRVLFWGEVDQKLDFTTVEDTARYTVAALREPATAGNRDLLVAGDSVSAGELATIFSDVTGEEVLPERLGSVDELRALVVRKKQTASNVWEYLAPQYLWTMMSGRGKLDPVMNNLYPAIRPISVREFLSRAFGSARVAKT